jgi:nitrogen fixation/metabolism regulation signal transduction histidine kinase
MASALPQPAPPAARHQRSVKNYLLDPGFQLKYTGYLVAITVVLSTALGGLLWRTSQEVLSQSRTAVAQGQETVRRGKELVKTSQDLSKVVQMNIAEKYSDAPETAALFNKGAEEKAKELAGEQKRLEEEAVWLDQQARSVEEHQARILLTLAVALSSLVVILGGVGIIITHKVAGPIFKMKRQIRELGDGRLRLPGKLRKGDELVEFFETFEDTVRSLRTRREKEIERLDAAISALEAEGVATRSTAALVALRDDLRSQLES